MKTLLCRRYLLPFLGACALPLWGWGAPFSNGSFEEPGIASGTEANIAEVTGWTGTGAGLRYLKNGNSHAGAAAVEGTHMVSFGHGGAVGDQLSRTFDTVPGKGYAVNFWFTAIDSEGDDFQVMEVEAFDGDTSLAMPEMQFLPWVGGQWGQGKTYSFTAASTSTTLVFRDVTSPIGGGETGNWALDGVAVTEINYPPGKVVAWGFGSAREVPAGLENVQAIAAGEAHALALTKDGNVVAWGANNSGQRIVPANLGPVKAIAAGGNHSMALLETGTVVAWGENHGDRAPPPGLNDAKAIADGYIYSAALRSNGTVAVWGDFATVGTADLSPPAGLADVSAISAGWSHMLALREPQGTVVAWGDNGMGQVTVPPEAASGVKAIFAAPLGSFAIKEDDTLLAWGDVGEIPEGLTHAKVIAASAEDFMAVKPDGTVVRWGPNFSGQQMPAGLSNVSQVAAGSSFSMALIQPLTPLPDPLEFTVITYDAGEPWEFTAKFPNQAGLYLRVQSAPVPLSGDQIDESEWSDLPGGGMMDLLEDGDEENWKLTTGDLPIGRHHFRVIAAAPGLADSKLVFSTPLYFESAAGKILFTYGDSFNRALMIMESDGSDQVALTDGTLSPLQCALSPGGIRAAFVTLGGELYVMRAQPMDAVENVPVNVLGGAPVTASFSSTMAWSPDGKRLAFAGDDNKIYVLRVVGDDAEVTPYDGATNALTAVVDTLSSAPNPAWSPDGKHMALLGANYIQVFQIMDSTGAITPQGPGNPLVALTKVSDSSTMKRSAAWSPDGQQLAFVERNVAGQMSFISILSARDGAGVLTPESDDNERLPLYDETDTPLAETVSWSRDGSLLAVGAKDGFLNYVEVFKPELVDETNPRTFLAGANLEVGAYQPSFGAAFMGTTQPGDDLPESTNFEIVRGLPGQPWTFSILQAGTIPGLTLRVESTLTPNDGDSWDDLPGGSLMERDGDLWTLLSSLVPVGNRYFRVVAEVDGYPPQITALATPYLVEREVVDNTPPTLAITHAWIEKISGKTHYRMYLDPRDETGFDSTHTIFVRTGPDVAKLQPFWREMPWTRGQPIGEPFTGTSITIEVCAQDAAGNKSTVQRRVFKSPLPLTAAPNIEPRLAGIKPFNENAIDCRGLFAGNFDGEGVGDDILQIDRTSGEVRVRRQGVGGVFVNDSFYLSPNSILDSAVADFDGDGMPDIVIAAGGSLKVYLNAGVDGVGVLQFQETDPAGLQNVSVAQITNCTADDITGEGKPDIVFTGATAQGDALVGVLINDEEGEFTAATSIATGPGISPGVVKLGDVDGDGWADVVMADALGKRLIVFRNKGQGVLAGYVEPDPAFQPKAVATGHQFFALPPQALAVADVTGDGRADAVVVMHWFASTNQDDPNDTRDHQVWQLLDGLEDGSLHPNPLHLVYHGPKADSGIDYLSDVLLQDLTGDRFPELIFTSHFEDPPAGGSRRGGVLVVRVNCQLDEANKLTSFDFTETPLSTDADNPHRLAAARFGNNPRKDIVLANGSNPQLQWITNGFTTLTKAMDIVGAITPESNPEGTEQANGVFTYFEYPGGFIDVTLTYANNTVNPFTNATIESQLPASLELVPGETDAGYVISGTGAARVIRWTETVPAGGAGAKGFRAKFLSNTKPGTALTPKVTLKGGGKTLSGSLPKVTVEEPLLFEWGAVVSSSDTSGLKVRFDETIFYRMKATNRGPAPVLNTVISMAVPAGTQFEGPVSAIDGVTYTPPTRDTKVLTFTIPQLNGGASTAQELQTNVIVKATKGQVKAAMTAQRPGGLKRTLPTWVTEIAPSLGIRVQADKTIARPGEMIEYTVFAKNWGSEKVTSARVVNVVPFGTTLVGARVVHASGNFTGPNEDAALLNENT
ncbi:MAG TPA: FG-GAP-like repeat-containing protein, partial [Prosthecobacter sp.]|nr:FG-GAP-like repeat-containing protein [Prosthecobacter sp.]